MVATKFHASSVVKSFVAIMIAVPHLSFMIASEAILSSDGIGIGDTTTTASDQGNLRLSSQTSSQYRQQIFSSRHGEEYTLVSRAVEYFHSFFGSLALPTLKDSAETNRSTLQAVNRGVPSEDRSVSSYRARLTSLEKSDDYGFQEHERRLNKEVRMWYVDWRLMTCVQDCPTEGEYSRATCGGYANPWETLWSTADLCCKVHLSWQPREQCTKLGRPEYLDLDAIWGIHGDRRNDDIKDAKNGSDFDSGDSVEVVEVDEEENGVVLVFEENEDEIDLESSFRVTKKQIGSNTNKVFVIVQGDEVEEESETEIRDWTVSERSPNTDFVLIGDDENGEDKNTKPKSNGQSQGKEKKNGRNPHKEAASKEDNEPKEDTKPKQSNQFRTRKGNASKKNPINPAVSQQKKESDKHSNSGGGGNSKREKNLPTKGRSNKKTMIDKVLTIVDGDEAGDEENIMRSPDGGVFRKRGNNENDDKHGMFRCWRSGTPCDTMAERFACCTICSEGHCL